MSGPTISPVDSRSICGPGRVKLTPSSGAIFGNSCGRRCLYIAPLTGDAELNPPTLRDKNLAPLAVEPSNGQIPYYKAFIDTGFRPNGVPEMVWSFPPVLKCLI